MPNFEAYITADAAEAGIKDGSLVKGTLRVSTMATSDGFCVRDSSADGDIYIQGKDDRNRAFNGDIITVKVVDETCDPVRGKVVHVNRSVWQDRVYICSLEPNMRNGNQQTSIPSDMVLAEDKFIKAIPVDKRIPWILIPVNEQVKRSLHLPGKLAPTTLYPVQVLKWAESSSLPLGVIKGPSIGSAGDVYCEEKCCLIEAGLENHGLDFPAEVYNEVSQLLSNTLMTDEIAKRVDFRKHRVITIDPATARDLDDAIHIVDIDEDTVEIGVHIADVSHYVKPGSHTDKVAKERCTSVYMCHKVFPMLPEQLSNGVCSLTANEDKLTFSCWFNMSRKTGLVIPGSEKFGKSVINSCCRFSYDEVQRIIDGDSFSVSSRPVVFHGHAWEDIVGDLHRTLAVCRKIRENRFDRGSMRIDKQKMIFKIDRETDTPVSFKLEEHSESHWMIEELMLMANKLVAIFISTESAFDPALQNSAVLRMHPPPEPNGIAKVKDLVSKLLGQNCPFDASTSKSLYQSLVNIRQSSGDDVANLVEYLVMKCMRPAEYVCLSTIDDVSHFALSFDFYTHFTSPIRRYADILVHRQIDWVLNKMSGNCIVDNIQEQCDKCNAKKKASRLAQEAFDTSFFCIYLRNQSTLTVCKAVVKAVMEKQIVVFVPQLAKEAPVFYLLNDKNSKFAQGYLVDEVKNLPMIKDAQVREGDVTLTWTNGAKRDISVLDPVHVVVLPLDSVPISFTLLLVP